jgi:hypothetical protein
LFLPLPHQVLGYARLVYRLLTTLLLRVVEVAVADSLTLPLEVVGPVDLELEHLMRLRQAQVIQ